MNGQIGSQVMPASIQHIPWTWGLSPDEWYAYDSQDDYDRWIKEMEEASDAGKQPADLMDGNQPF